MSECALHPLKDRENEGRKECVSMCAWECVSMCVSVCECVLGSV